MATLHYRALLEPDGHGGYGMVFPEVPGCVSAGDDATDALRMATEALAAHLNLMLEDGEPLPEPAAPDAPLPEWLDFEDAVRLLLALIPFEQPGRAVRLNISMEETMVARVDAAAEARGMSRSAFLTEAARQKLATG